MGKVCGEVEMNKQIFDHLKRIASAWECECAGNPLTVKRPCPTCADVRKLADGEWKEPIQKDIETGKGYVSFGNIMDNPDYSIPDIVAHLKTLKLWQWFGEWLFNVYWINLLDNFPDKASILDILTDPDLFKQAVLSYLEGVE